MKQENYVIGLDLGINNVGWSILDLESHNIEKSGVRLFERSSAAKDRRSNRSTRRRLKRSKNRVADALKLFDSIGVNIKPSIDEKLIEKRVKGLKEQINLQDIVNITKYFMQHRGYIPFDDEEVNFIELNGKYPCEYYLELFKEKGKIRALNETVKITDNLKEYECLLSKQTEYYPDLNNIKEELISIFKRKREFWEGPGSENSLTPYGRFKTAEDVLNYRKNKEENPSYEKYIFEELIGKCNVVKLNQPCATKANIFAEKFNLINDFVNITFTDISDTQQSNYFCEVSNGYKLNEKGINAIIDYCMNCDSTLKLDKMFKELFNLSTKNAKGYRENKEKKIEMSTMDAYRTILRLIKKLNTNIPKWIEDYALYNMLMYYINVVPSSTGLIEMLKKDKNFSECIKDEDIELIKLIYSSVKTKFSGYHSLSEFAIVRANNDMLATNSNFQQVRKNFDYDKAYREKCSKDYISTNGKLKLTDKYIDELIASPQVKKTLRQSIKVINAIINEKKSLPTCISIESEKEVNGKDRKAQIEKEQKIQETLRKSAAKIIEENGYEVSNKLILKVMLYEEINGYCPYCNSQQISLKDVLDNKIEVEHILPLSKSADDSYNNKTLSCRMCNDKKSNRTPYEWLNGAGYDDFKMRILNNKNFSDIKKNNFLLEQDLDKHSIRFINRNLRDTAYATKELVNQINMFNMYLEENYKTRINTLSTPGQITHKIRENYEIDKDRDAGKFHHAVDACIVASIADTKIGEMIIKSQNDAKFWIVDSDLFKKRQEKLSSYLKNVNLDKYYKIIKDIDDDSKINISSQVLKSPQGKLSDANISKYIVINGEYNMISQINNIYEEKISDLEKLFEDNTDKHLMIKDNNPQLYSKLKEIYKEYKDKGGNPFKNYCFDKCQSEMFDDISKFNYMIHGIKASNNPKSPIVKKLRYYSKVTTPYLLTGKKYNKKEQVLIGLNNLKQYCTEIYYDIDNNKFAFLPIFSVSVDLNKKIINKNDSYYLYMKETYLKGLNLKYITSIYNGDYISFIKKNNEKCEGIYSGYHKTHNMLKLKKGLSFTKTDKYFTKSDKSFTIYDVDVLGNKKERLTYSIK